MTAELRTLLDIKRHLAAAARLQRDTNKRVKAIESKQVAKATAGATAVDTSSAEQPQKQKPAKGRSCKPALPPHQNHNQISQAEHQGAGSDSLSTALVGPKK